MAAPGRPGRNPRITECRTPLRIGLRRIADSTGLTYAKFTQS
jgi:hypothetical protein